MSYDDVRKIILPVVLILFLLTITPFISSQSEGEFNTTARVVEVAAVDNNFTQEGVPATGGVDVNFSMHVMYDGTATLNVTVGKPENFTNGFDWRVNESGDIKSVTEKGGNLIWEANLSVNDVTLLFTVLPPVISVVSEKEDSTVYEKRVKIGSENPFTNVTAKTSINTNYKNFRLFEMNGSQPIERTEEYNFSVNGSTAEWHGFNLSTQTFRINGTKQPSQSRSSGGGSSSPRVVRREAQSESPAEVLDISLMQDWINLSIEKGVRKLVNITLWNKGDFPVTVNVTSMADFIHPMEDQITLPPDESEDVPVFLTPSKVGPNRGRVMFSVGNQTLYTFFDIFVEGDVKNESNRTVDTKTEKAKNVSSDFSEGKREGESNLWIPATVLVLFVATFLAVRRWDYSRRKRELEEMTKEEIKKHADKEYGVELDMNDRKDEMIDELLKETQ